MNACRAVIAGIPSCKVLLGLSALIFISAIVLYLIVARAHWRAHRRHLAGLDRYPLGDDAVPPRHLMRSHFGGR